jgi:zinc and cadmium transporter
MVEVPWFEALMSVFLISIVSLVGVMTISLGLERLKGLLLILVSFSVGSLFGGTFFHLLPEAFARQGFGPEVPMWTLTGILLFFVLEKFIHWRHCHVPASEEHLHPVVFMNLVGDAMHNFIDGILIGAAYLVSVPIGITTTLAVVAHEIPQEIGDFGTLVYGGLSVKKALLVNFASALTAVLGVVLVLTFGPHVGNISNQILPLTAGGFIYIAGSDLIPELRKDTGVKASLAQFLAILAGLFVIYFVTHMMGGHSHLPGHHH